jgi:Ni/Fe-hydrogenase subunit HybB-like protein
MSILSDLGRVLYAVLGVYTVVRVYDLWDRGALPALFSLEYEPVMLQLELALGVILPLVLLAPARLRNHRTWLYASALLVVGGFVANRLNVSITGIESAQGGHYIPSWPEVALSLLMVALGFGAFSLAATYLDLYPQPRAPARLERPRPELYPVAAQSLSGSGRATFS